MDREKSPRAAAVGGRRFSRHWRWRCDIRHTVGRLYDTGYNPRYFEVLRDWTHWLIRWSLPVDLKPEEGLARQMAAAGLCAADFQRVIVSHFHLDHIAGLHLFPGAQLVYAAGAWDAVKSLTGWRAARAVYHPGLVDHAQIQTHGRAIENADAQPWEEFSSTWDLFGDGSLRLVALPGHAPGQIGAVFRRTGDRRQMFLLSDACWTHANLRGRPPSALAHFLMDDPMAFHDTLGRLGAFARAHPETLLVPSHCAATLAELIPA